MKKSKGEKDNKVKYGTVSLPMPLIEKIKEKIKGTGMGSVSSYVAFVIRQVIASSQSKEAFDEKEEIEVREKLSRLGYI